MLIFTLAFVLLIIIFFFEFWFYDNNIFMFVTESKFGQFSYI